MPLTLDTSLVHHASGRDLISRVDEFLLENRNAVGQRQANQGMPLKSVV